MYRKFPPAGFAPGGGIRRRAARVAIRRASFVRRTSGAGGYGILRGGRDAPDGKDTE
ncbi:MAG: hypothetical protein ACR2QC_08715 [Gammaproteobacteria bacterium]